MKSKSSGMALLPVLFIIALITIVVVMFFSLSTMQYRSSTTQAAAQDVSSLRDMALNLAIGQLRQGTTENDALWISQPGAIRTFVADSGAASNIYKLYSSGEMTTSAAGLNAAAQNLEGDVPANWNAIPQVYANLNEPVIRDSGDLAFPIIDPRAMDMETPTYPTSKTPEGFSYSGIKASGDGIHGVHLPGSSPENQRLPMPVQWIYILANGSYGVLDASTKNFVPFLNQGPASSPTSDNPIIGRIAFWTDDETCKVNINTASEGLHWDTPRAATPEDVEYASRTPVRNEVQRFAGHPASTSLSSVFFPGERLTPGEGNNTTRLMQIYDMVPRVNYRSGNSSSSALAGVFTSTGLPVAYDTDRLYASVDEFLLQAPGTDPSAIRATQPLFATAPEKLARLRFFLTAESRAPETTAMGTPRMSLWPTSADPDSTSDRYTSFDRLALFSTTLGGKAYCYRRYSSPTSAMTEYGADASSAAQTWLDILKGNGDLTRYIIALSTDAKQGYSASLRDKYGEQNMAAGIISMFEYARQTNIHDTTLSVTGTKVAPYDMGVWGKNTYGPSEAHGQIINVADPHVPQKIGDQLRADPNVRLNALNRIYTISEFGLVLSLAAENRDGTPAGTFNSQLVEDLNLPPGYKAIQIGVVFEGFCPSQGYSMIAPAVGTYINQLPTLRLVTSDSSSGRMAGGAVTGGAPNYEQASLNTWGRWNDTVPSLCYLTGINMTGPDSTKHSKGAKWWVGWGGSGGRHLYSNPVTESYITSGYVTNVNQLGRQNFFMPQFNKPGPDESEQVPANQYSRGFFLVPSGDTHVTLKSGYSLHLYSGYVNHGPNHSRIMHRFTIPPNTVVPIPGQPVSRAWTWHDRVINAGKNRAKNPELIDPNDTVRTWIVRHGDYRLVSLRENELTNNLPANHRLFTPHPGWNPPEQADASQLADSQEKRQIHSFTRSGGEWENQQLEAPPELPVDQRPPSVPSIDRPLRGLVKDVTYTAKSQPDFARSPTSTEFFPAKPSGYNYSIDPSETRDWDNGSGIAPDGAYWNKADDVAHIWDDTFKNVASPTAVPGATPPYFSPRVWDGVGPDQLNETIAPNQLIPSAVMFGSISSGVHTGLPWTTYLFRPNLSSTGHLGEKDHAISGHLPGAPPDHTLLDWFWMPVLQPYAISEPFSTAGKINMNYRMVPFTYIKRATGLHALMKSERFLAIPTSAGPTYKDYASANSNTGWRHYIDVDQTLVQWEERFNAGYFFKNASEICEQYLVPKDQDINADSISTLHSQMTDFWDDHRLSGDNTLERPYANLYPRLTTRSNTFRVHFLVQSLRKARTSDPQTFDDTLDNITGESQGDALIERAIDPNDPALDTSDYDYLGKANNDDLSSTRSLDTLYTWRIRHVRNFGR